MNADTRAWFATRFQNVAYRIIAGGQQIPPGHVVVPEDELQALIEGRLLEEDDEPIDPEEMRRTNLNRAMRMNDDVEPLVEHVKSIRTQLISSGFTEEAAEHMCMSVWHGILGIMVEDD